MKSDAILFCDCISYPWHEQETSQETINLFHAMCNTGGTKKHAF